VLPSLPHASLLPLETWHGSPGRGKEGKREGGIERKRKREGGGGERGEKEWVGGMERDRGTRERTARDTEKVEKEREKGRTAYVHADVDVDIDLC
jgi:hypothetical protein